MRVLDRLSGKNGDDGQLRFGYGVLDSVYAPSFACGLLEKGEGASASKREMGDANAGAWSTFSCWCAWPVPNKSAIDACLVPAGACDVRQHRCWWHNQPSLQRNGQNRGERDARKTAPLRTSPPPFQLNIAGADRRGRRPLSGATRARKGLSNPPSPPSVTNLSPMPVTQSSSCGTTFFSAAAGISAGSNASSGTGFLFSLLIARAARMRSPRAAREKHSTALAAAKAASGLTAQRSLSVTLPVRLASPEQWVLGAPPPGMRWGRSCDRTEEAIAPARQATPNCITFSPAGARTDSFSPCPRGLPEEVARFWSAVLGTDGRWNQRTSQSPGHSHTRTREPVERFPLSLLF
ncbi:hypothetical protein MRX96_038002 [Rhipicephalus microplus]